MIKHLFTTLITVFFILFAIFVANSDELPTKKELESNKFFKEFSGKARVLDGDSILVDQKEVRLFGIDAPEYKQTCLDKDNKGYHCGQMSFLYLKKLINNKKVNCSYQKKDIYDRYLAKCYFETISINDNLLENGMAVIYDYRKSSDRLKNLEKKAKENKKGMWQGGFELPRHYRKRNK
ncbi:MAG: thermonuclease family protein [Rickettsiales bacterium]|nr:thermonuclease family protein [Rickettsiales bacterium]